MASSKPVKVSCDTHGKMLRILGEIQQETDERITMDKTIVKLIDFWYNGEEVKKK